jgi:hypothetical protein
MATYLTTPVPEELPCHATGFKPTEDVDHQIQSIAQHWLSRFELAASTNDGDLFASLFVEEGFWRDIIGKLALVVRLLARSSDSLVLILLPRFPLTAFTNDYRSIRTGNISAAAKVAI